VKLVRDRYSDELPVPLSEFERAQLFRRVEAELDRRPRRARPVVLAVAVAIAALAGGVALGYRARSAPAEAAPALVAPSAARESIELPDGSRALLDPSVELRVDAAEPLRIRLTLLEGRASFEVGEVEGRSFVVGAGPVDVNVLGGKVAIAYVPSLSPAAGPRDWSVEVHATEGRVSVHRKSGGATVTLEAGGRWSSLAGSALALEAGGR